MKKKLIIILVIIITLVSIGVLVISQILKLVNQQMEDLVETTIVDVDLSTLDDGTYIGEVKTIPIRVIVEVEIFNHQIIEIRIIEHRSGQGESGEMIINDILLNQSLNVDIISGATYSSRAIMIAISKALKGTPND
jgi:uncharacterized protein with FMN-binding domain